MMSKDAVRKTARDQTAATVERSGETRRSDHEAAALSATSDEIGVQSIAIEGTTIETGASTNMTEADMEADASNQGNARITSSIVLREPMRRLTAWRLQRPVLRSALTATRSLRTTSFKAYRL